ncbi:SDR family NAD(P)-dependent oxidoreductase, partial [Streptomyces sp. B1866]|uniref:SDR family NAD(P)-dependent oxidoreductase n=1 Tax=Streptomyces sp. B1866 TaxID=3075431 RepID=UPI00288CA777
MRGGALSDNTLADHFLAVFEERPDQHVFRFLSDDGGAPAGISNAAVDARVRAVAATLRERAAPGDRALIVCPPGLDYVVSFLACLYSGVVAVPVYPLDPAFLKRTLDRLTGIVEDARPAVVLAPAAIAALTRDSADQPPLLREALWLSVDAPEECADPGSWRRPDLTADAVAFLQYTSGSTSRPKGVMVSHGNLLHNLRHLGRVFGTDLPERGPHHMVTWLPPYHDMGLIAGVLAPAFGSYPVTMMSPFSFLKRPLRWLRAIAEQGGTVSGAPNFAYDLCVAKTTEEERAALDLSRWQVAFSGAEPIRDGSLRRFADAFAVSGFRMDRFMPGYGLAEATLLVSAGGWRPAPVVRDVRADALAEGRAEDPAPGEPSRALVGCGPVIAEHRVVVADPDTGAALPDGRVGEIWFGGPSVAQGYWERPDLTESVFRARTAAGDGPFLRTGDLGFHHDGELYVTGRTKDVIIVAGRNHYPQDIELAVERADPALQPHGGVAGVREIDGEERLVVVQEIAGRLSPRDAGRIVAAIRAAVATESGLEVHVVALVRRGQVPKTSSGKLRRAACLDALFAGELRELGGWRWTDGAPAARAADAAQPAGAVAPVQPVQPVQPAEPADAAELADWLAARLARQVGAAPREVDRATEFAAFGLRSADAVGLVGDLERHLGRELPATLLWSYPTVDALAAHLAHGSGPAGQDAARPAPAPAAGPAPAREPIAIVGIGCRFPGGADGPASFWRLLTEGRDAVGEVPADRWDADAVFAADPAAPGRTNSRWGGFLDRVDAFDHRFFGISEPEAARVDPQQRLLAEVAWEALEDAGLPADRLAGSRTGVYVGISSFDYGGRQLGDLGTIDAWTGTGSALSIAANRLSYLLDLRGPSMAVDTACSSSLVAVEQARAALERGDCDLALAGGVNLILSPAAAVNFSKAGVMSPEGRCKPFSADADGYVRSEGAGIVVLKPLSRALADQDTVYAVVRGGAVNQDGRSNGLMAPNPHAQEAVLRDAYRDAGVEPADVDYVEAHGTGTPLGDPIEARALGAVLSAGRDPGRPCLVGSVKSNLGHLEAAAGVAGLVKAALMLRHRHVPPSLHAGRTSPHIPFDELRLRVAGHAQPWPHRPGPALAGVSSFGFGGTNAHLVLAEAPEPPAPVLAEAPEPPAPAAADDGLAWPLTLSARDETALRAAAARLEERLADPGFAAPARALAHTAAVRRTHHEHRLAVVGDSRAAYRAALAAYRQGEDAPGLAAGRRRPGRRPRAVFVFSGQGPRWWPVAGDLADTRPAFRSVLAECDALLRRWADWSLLAELAADPDASRLAEPEAGQAALCAVQIALAAQWRAWGVEPAAVVGHSVGEIAAAHVAGALSLPDALRTALRRGQAVARAVGRGRMAVAALPAERATRLLAELRPGPVWVAAANSPGSTVFSGEPAALAGLLARLEADGVWCRPLESVDFGSHSPLMEPVAAELRQALAGLAPRAARLPMLSTVTAAPVAGTDLDAGYWAANLKRPVRFDEVVKALVAAGHDAFVEVSPHPMLQEAVAERIAHESAEGVVTASLHRDQPGRTALLAGLGRLYAAGYPVPWERVFGAPEPPVPLPSYPWQPERAWLPEPAAPSGPAATGGHPALGSPVRSAVPPEALHFSARVGLDGFPWLRDHAVEGAVVLPGAFVMDAVLAAAREVLGDAGAVVEDLRLDRPTVVPERPGHATLQLVCRPGTAGAGSVRVFSRDGADPAGEWTEVAGGACRLPSAPGETRAEGLAEVRARCADEVPADGHYASLAASGLEYGPAFRGVEALWRGAAEAVGRLADAGDAAAARQGPEAYLVHPALLDSALQVLAAALPPRPDGSAGAPYLPVGAGRFALSGTGARPRWAHAALADGAAADAEEITGRVVLYDASGEVAGEVAGIRLRRLADGRADPVGAALRRLEWHPAPADAPGADGWWLLLADRGGVCASLREDLADRAHVTVVPGDGYRRLADDRFEIDPAAPEQYARLLADLRGRPGRWAGAVHAWSLDAAGDGPDTLWTARDGGVLSALHLVAALAAAEDERPARLVLLTRGAQQVSGQEPPPALAQAGLWGLARVVRLEHGDLDPVVVDLDPAGGAAGLREELLRGGPEDQLALRGGQRYAPRLAPWAAGPEQDRPAWRQRPLGPDGNHRLLALRPGLLDSLAPARWRRRPPGYGQVEIEVRAAGLNFNDVLKALDTCPGVPPGASVPLGGECAGVVTAVGEGVADLRPGDAVMAVSPSSMARWTTTEAALVAPRPAGLDDEQAAAVPIAFLTAVYGLDHLARLRRGERVLIHAAAGGVGLAALQVARRAGAEVFATAGSEEKRELLRRLGVRHVMDSRSLRFADEVAELTGGRGVDVVLNSLAGEALTRGLALLAPGGRFVEIGKRDVYDDSRLGLGALRHNRSFLAVDLELAFTEQHGLVAELMAQVVDGFAGGEFTALPVASFPYERAAEAFALMAGARHTGKVVLRPDARPPATVADRPGGPVRADATYLVTGGLGGLGLETARYLAGQGARHLALAGRGAPSERAEEVLAALRADGAEVRVCAADVARAEDVGALLDGLARTMPPVAGIVHAAGVLRDGLLKGLGPADFEAVAAPKAAGAWHLHQAARERELELDFFVLYSSAAALLGSASQGNYAAANAYLDALALHRAALGLPALTVDWGPWAEVGLAARPDRGGALAARGVLSLRPADGVAALDRLLAGGGAQACVLPLDTAKLREEAAAGLLPSLLRDL